MSIQPYFDEHVEHGRSDDDDDDDFDNDFNEDSGEDIVMLDKRN